MTQTRAAASADAQSSAWLLSSDSHIVEPPDLWKGREGGLGDRMPRVVALEDGQWWFVDGRKTMSFLGIQTGQRFEGKPDALRTSGSFEQVRPAAYEPSAYVAENESDGVWGSVLYPSQGLVLFSVPVGDVVTLAMQGYNDWIAEFCRAQPSRLKGIAMLNLDDIDAGVRELTRCRELGLAGALISVGPPRWQPYRSPVYDRVWAAAQDLDLPLSLHTATERGDIRVGAAAFTLDVQSVPPSVFINKDQPIRHALAEMIFSGVFERFPRLRVGSVEHELAWIPFFLDQMDYTYTQRPPRGPEWHRFREAGVLPSDYFRRNVFASFQEDQVAMRMRDVIGVHTLMWGSDYPHTESTFPRSRQILSQLLRDVDAADAAAIVCRNCAGLYHFDVPKD